MRAPTSLLGLLIGLIFVPAAAGHGGGKAEPRIAAGVSGEGRMRVLTVRLSDVDSRAPIRGASVVATGEMVEPHLMRLAPWRLPEPEPGIYRARVDFVMSARWEVSISVSGEDVTSASSRFQTQIDSTGPSAGLGPKEQGVESLPTRLEDELGRRDVTSMAVLWLHGIAAVGWIAGVLMMAVALATPPGVLAEGIRARVSAWYRTSGAWLHWACVPLIVATGVYNMVYVTPFPLVWRPSQLDELADIPYGALYEAVLVVKLGLFAGLLITGTHVLIRTLRPAPAMRPGRGLIASLGAALGPPGIFYLASVPLILAAAVALRYIHVLSHVGAVLSEQ